MRSRVHSTTSAILRLSVSPNTGTSFWDEDQFRWRRKRRHRKLWQFECIFCGCLVNIETGGKANASDGRFNHRTCRHHVLRSKQLGHLASNEAIARRRRQAFEGLREEVLAQRAERLMTALRSGFIGRGAREEYWLRGEVEKH
jgi:hypothetical protein